MNEADLPSINLDELRLVPDWLREDAPSPSKQYASYDRPLETDQRDRRSPRPGGGQGARDRRAAPPDRGGRDRRDDRNRSGPAPRGRADQTSAPREPEPPLEAAPIRVEFLPDERCMASIIKQIRTTHMAYPLFSLARMFLQEPARHYLQLSLVPGASKPGSNLHQLGDDGPVVLDRAALEKVAFDTMKDRFYKEEVIQKDPPKGNFTNVARERLSGTLLGPTNYHGYQPALRALYESRFSRRMPFEEYRRNIEISSDPTLVERWKEDARTVTTISTIEGEPPTVLPSQAEARVHFRQHYLESLLHTGMSFRVHGSVARRLPEAAVMQAIREAHEREVRYPAQFVQLLRQGLQNAGLHIFKHRKRIVYVAASRPTPFVPERGAVAENVSLILETIAELPLCTRKVLADRVLRKRSKANTRPLAESITLTVQPADTAPSVLPQLATAPGSAENAPPLEQSVEGLETTLLPVTEVVSLAPAPPVAQPADDEISRAKTALAADLRFMVQAGHIIEFHNGTFDLPLSPKAKEEPVKKSSFEAARDDTASIGADPAQVQRAADAPLTVQSEVETAPAQAPDDFMEPHFEAASSVEAQSFVKMGSELPETSATKTTEAGPEMALTDDDAAEKTALEERA